MNTKQIKAKVAEIEACKDDPEKAHALEDDLYMEVLQAIRDGAMNPDELAREALESSFIDFPRWCA